MSDKSGQTRNIENLENQLKIVSRAWMESESARKQAVFDFVKTLEYFGFKTDDIMSHYARDDLDKVRELGQEAINDMEATISYKNMPVEVRDQGTSPLYINPQDSNPSSFGTPIRIDRPPGIDTRSIRKVKGPQVRRGNIEKKMDEFIPSRRSNRLPK